MIIDEAQHAPGLFPVLRVPAAQMRRFWTMVAHYHAQTWNGAELDLLFVHDGHPIGVAVTRTSTASITPSIRNAIVDLGLRHVYVVHPGPDRYLLSDTVTAVPLADLAGRWLP